MEYKDKNIPKCRLVPKSPPWDPSTLLHSSQEDGMINYKGRLIGKFSTDPHGPDMTVNSVVSAFYMAVDITDNKNFATALDHHIKVDMTKKCRQPISPLHSGSLPLTPTACLALGYSSTQGQEDSPVHHSAWCKEHCKPKCRFHSNNCMLQYHCLHHTIFTDTLFASTQSRHGNKYAKIIS